MNDHASPSWLFVCYGNICRSPMAEAMARQLLPKDTLIDSAGTNAWSDSPPAETVAVMRDLYGLDISRHRPKKLADVPLDVYDHIVALSPEVADHIRFNYPGVSEKLICRDILDPYQDGIGAFERCARQIEESLKELLS